MSENLSIEYNSSVEGLSQELCIDDEVLSDAFKGDQGFLTNEFREYTNAGNRLNTFCTLAVLGIVASCATFAGTFVKTNSNLLSFMATAAVFLPSLYIANKADQQLNRQRLTKKTVYTKIENSYKLMLTNN